MRTSQLILSILLAVLLVGSVTAQPSDQSGRNLLASDLYPRSATVEFLVDDLCNSSIQLLGSPTEYRHVTEGTCIQISPNCTCTNCVSPPCTCSVTITDGSYYYSLYWDCETCQIIDGNLSDWCFTIPEGDYTFYVDVCPGQDGEIRCGSCCR